MSALVLAITPQDNLLHVGTAAALLGHLHEEDLDLEFYDATGQRLRPVKDAATGKTDGLVPDPEAGSPGAADRQLLIDRIDVFQARVQVVLDRRMAEGYYDPDPPPWVRAPRVDGELKEMLLALDALDGSLPDPTEPDPGSPLHNLWHATFG